MRPARALSLVKGMVALTVLLAACGGSVRRGATLYSDGRYIEAAEVFERTERQLNEMSPRERAEYGVYRGMTLLVLGDLRHAHRWLTYAYQVEQYAPGSLGSDRRSLLERGWYELGQRLRDTAPLVTAPQGPALAASQPAEPRPPPATTPPPVTERRSLVPQ
jgi:tetratricopeptide (TPR) repeat protein